MIKELISELQADPDNYEARERIIELIIERDWESWVDWSSKDLAETIADLQRGAAEPLCSEKSSELIAIILECPDCGKTTSVKTAVESENFLQHKKCFLNGKTDKKESII